LSTRCASLLTCLWGVEEKTESLAGQPKGRGKGKREGGQTSHTHRPQLPLSPAPLQASYERGFAHASVRTTVEVNLNKLKAKGDAPHHRFGNLLPPDGPSSASGRPQTKFCESLGADGLPEVGQALRDGDPICAILDLTTGAHELRNHKSSGGESGGAAVVEEVRQYRRGEGHLSWLDCDRPLPSHSGPHTLTLAIRNQKGSARDNNPSIGRQSAEARKYWTTCPSPFSFMTGASGGRRRRHGARRSGSPGSLHPAQVHTRWGVAQDVGRKRGAARDVGGSELSLCT
jgi:hypothetical protein